jgi:ABC-type Fe3+-citrate transport system substrate-binding protein
MFGKKRRDEKRLEASEDTLDLCRKRLRKADEEIARLRKELRRSQGRLDRMETWCTYVIKDLGIQSASLESMLKLNASDQESDVSDANREWFKDNTMVTSTKGSENEDH